MMKKWKRNRDGEKQGKNMDDKKVATKYGC